MWFVINKTDKNIPFVSDDRDVVCAHSELFLPDKDVLIYDTNDFNTLFKLLPVHVAYGVIAWACNVEQVEFPHYGACVACCDIATRLPDCKPQDEHGPALLRLQAKAISFKDSNRYFFKPMSATPYQLPNEIPCVSPNFGIEMLNSYKLLFRKL